MSTKQQTLSWLTELPDESLAWRELHDDARMLRDIAAAEQDVRNGRERPLAEAMKKNGVNVVPSPPDRLGVERSSRAA